MSFRYGSGGLGSARVSRAGDGVLAIADFSWAFDAQLVWHETTLQIQRKFVAARRRNQHARRLRSPGYAVPLPSPAPKVIPCASGSAVEKLIVFV